MPTEKKAQTIDLLEQELAKANIGILTDYRGLKTPEINSLRRKLQDVNGDYKVVKNTLVRKAAEKLNQTAITGSFEGPTAIAFGYGDISQLAKTFSDHVRTSKMNLSVKGGFMSNTLPPYRLRKSLLLRLLAVSRARFICWPVSYPVP
jgi:large subunit ribosomal protein L10